MTEADKHLTSPEPPDEEYEFVRVRLSPAGEELLRDYEATRRKRLEERMGDMAVEVEGSILSQRNPDGTFTMRRWVEDNVFRILDGVSPVEFILEREPLPTSTPQIIASYDIDLPPLDEPS